MKLILKLIKIAIIFILIGICFYLLINKAFIFDRYKSEVMEGDGIPINKFMYVIEHKKTYNVEFYTFLSKEKLVNKKEEYLNSIESCYGIYYYDKDNDITITKYDIEENKYYNLVKLSYATDNYCSNDYKLSDMWVYDYINKSKYINGDISEKAMNNIVDKVYQSNRANIIIKEYESKYTYKVYCENEEEKYTLIFSDFSENELLVKKETNGNIEFAVYEVENVIDYLGGLNEIN